MRNKFPGPCYKCGLWVPPGSGYFERHKGKWRVQHGHNTHNGGITCDLAKTLHETKLTNHYDEQHDLEQDSPTPDSTPQDSTP